MKLHLHSSTTQNTFTAHGAGYVVVGGRRFERPIVVMPEEVLSDWPVQTFADLNDSHFDYFRALRPEIVLLGTGPQLRFPDPRLYRNLLEARIGVECMDTAAACRTYNILMAEGRKVAAAILL